MCEAPFRDCRQLLPLLTCQQCQVTVCQGCSVGGFECIHCEKWFCGRVTCASYQKHSDDSEAFCCLSCQVLGGTRERCTLCHHPVRCNACAACCEHTNLCEREPCDSVFDLIPAGCNIPCAKCNPPSEAPRQPPPAPLKRFLGHAEEPPVRRSKRLAIRASAIARQ